MSERRPLRTSAELARLRAEIDELDRHIVRLLNERAERTVDVGHEKAALGRRAIRDRKHFKHLHGFLFHFTLAADLPRRLFLCERIFGKALFELVLM